MSKWKEVKIADLVEKICVGFVGPCQKFYCEKENGVPMIRTTNLTERDISFNDVKYISYEFHQKNKKSQLKKGDILVARHGDNGKACMYNSTSEANCLNAVIMRPDSAKINPNFFIYQFNSPHVRGTIESMSSGSVQDVINTKQIAKLNLLIPERNEQNKIASILSSLDDKIDLLRRQNKTLEAMAEALFRQWFVEEADEEWKEGTLGDVIELIYGKGLKKEIRTGIGYPVIGSSGVVGYHSEFLVEGPGIVIGRKGTLGKVIYLWDDFFPIDTTYYIKSKVESAGLLYEYFLLKTLNFEEMNSDSAVPGLNRDIALSTEIKIAPLDKLNMFNQFTSTFIDKLRENTKQIGTLEKLRDTLLPKLISGQIRIKNLENINGVIN